MQDKEKKYFLSEDSQCDADSAPFAVSPNSWVNSENVRIRTTDAGVTMVVESVGGTLLVSDPSPSVTFITLGSADDTTDKRILYFMYNIHSDFHKILCYYPLTNLTYVVVTSDQITGGLTFNKDYPIHSARVVEGLLIWTDNYNEPKCIKIDAGILLNDPTFSTTVEAYTLPIAYESTTLIKRPPVYRLTMTKVNDAGFDNNFIADKAYQFTYRYIYKYYQVSVLATYSQLAPFNGIAESSNAIDVYLSYDEDIDDDIQIVQICVRNGNYGDTTIIKQYDKNNPDDLTAIENHNNGIGQLGFRFYDNIAGILLDTTEANTAFDPVPLLAEALELARYRLFLGNILSGYNTPSTNSLAVTLTNTDTGATGDFTGTWKYVTLHANFIGTGIQDTFNFPYVIPDSDPTKCYYFPSVRNSTIWNGGIGTVPSTISLSLATFSNDTEANLVAYLKATNYPTGSSVGTPPWDAGYDPGYIIGGAVTVLDFQPVSVTQFFKSNSNYLVNIAFFDRFRRKCGVSSKPVSVEIPIRTYNQTTFTTILNWTLSNTNALEEIPDWAYYYQIHITKNLVTRDFVQARAYDASYVKKNQDGTYTYSIAAWAQDVYAIGIDLTTLVNYGLGYVFTQGDKIVLYLDPTTNYTLSVLAQDGNFVLVAPLDIGTLNSSSNILYELYTPYREQIIEPYFETGDMIPISDPTLTTRAYSSLVGQINGDCYSILRKDKAAADYIVEAMSPNDNVWEIWDTDRGWTNYIDNIGQVRKTNTIKYSDTVVLGTKNNGINKYQIANEKSLDNEMGTLRKIILTSKVEGEQGGIMLGICEAETGSLYLGETQQYGSSSQTTLTLSSEVIGSINVLKGSFGTINPESVAEYRGNVFWLDASNGKYIQYGANGLFPISNYKMTRFWKQFCNLFTSMTKAEIEVFGGRPFVFSTVDPHHNELLISIPKLADAPPKGYLPDYPFIQYPFDIWDAQGKTMVYKLEYGEGRPIWLGAYKFNPENFISFQDDVYSFNNGNMYLHNQVSNPCEFYGVQYSSKIMPIGNKTPSHPKEYQNTTVEANLKPDFVYMYNDYPILQISNLINDDFRDLEGVWYATIKRNNIRITNEGYVYDNLMTGEKMRNVAMWFMYEWRINGVALNLKFVDIGFTISRGHPI